MLWRFTSSVLFLIAFCCNLSIAQDGSLNIDERILNFHADIVVDTNAAVTISEKIKVRALGWNIKRGIFRTLPNKRTLQNHTFYVKYEVQSVKKNGEEEPFHTKNENGNFVIYIGDANISLPQGVYEYELTYKTYRQIGFFPDFDELYWNVCGNDWAFMIDKVSATITLPEGVEILQNACYTGLSGDTAHNCTSKLLSANALSWTAYNLPAGAGLTVAVGFKKGLLHAPVAPQYIQPQQLKKNFYAAFAVLLAFLAGIWYKYGRDPQKPTVVPEFTPPQGLSPAALGYMSNAQFSNSLITAAFVNLAIKKAVTITESKSEGFLGLGKRTIYTITKKYEPTTNLSQEEQVLYNNMGNVLVLTGAYSPSTASMVTQFTADINKQLKPKYIKGSNRGKIGLPYVIILAIYLFILIATYLFTFNSDKLIIGIIWLVGINILYLPIYMNSAVRYRLVRNALLAIIPLLILWLYHRYYDMELEPFNMAYVFLGISLFILAVFKYLLEKPSPELLQTEASIAGFKMYLSAAESQLLKFHNPPQMTPQVFEQMLPYALVLGVDKIWGEKFEKFLSNNDLQYESHWYNGYSGAFSHNMSSSFAQSFSSAISTASTAPSSSGSGGGGSSGGGGGGGGGGGW